MAQDRAAAGGDAALPGAVVGADGRPLSFRESDLAINTQLTVAKAIRDTLGARARSDSKAPRIYRKLGPGGGYVTLCPGRLLAPMELEQLRRAGKVRLSPSQPLVLARQSNSAVTSLGWATNELMLPDNRLNCVLYALAALLSTSWAVLAPPGEPMLELNPKLVSYADVMSMVARARKKHFPLGALQLPRSGFRASWEWVATVRSGVFLFVGLLLTAHPARRRHAATSSSPTGP